jgi:hypothetical protein
MKEWLSLDPASKVAWLPLAERASTSSVLAVDAVPGATWITGGMAPPENGATTL